MDSARLAEIEARAKAATEGPWHSNKYGSVGAGKYGTSPMVLESGWDGIPSREPPNLEFAAHARQDIPDLIAYVRELEGQRDWLVGEIDAVKEEHDWQLAKKAKHG